MGAVLKRIQAVKWELSDMLSSTNETRQEVEAGSVMKKYVHHDNEGARHKQSFRKREELKMMSLKEFIAMRREEIARNKVHKQMEAEERFERERLVEKFAETLGVTVRSLKGKEPVLLSGKEAQQLLAIVVGLK